MAYPIPLSGPRRPLPRWARRVRQLRQGQVFLAGADQDGLYLYDPQLGFFKKIGKMFKRMVKFTPKSFRPANIFRAATSASLTLATGGLYQALPSKLKKGIENVGAAVIPYALGAAAAIAVGPAVIGFIGPKLMGAASLIGKGISAGGTFLSFLGKLGPSQQQQVAEQISPEQIAAMERSGQIDPQWARYLAQQPAPMPPMSSYFPAPAPVPPMEQFMTPEERAAYEQTERQATAPAGGGAILGVGAVAALALLSGGRS